MRVRRWLRRRGTAGDRGWRDDGSMLPMILMALVVAATLVMVTTAAGSAFLAQRDLQSVCDGAALAGAQAVDFADLAGSRSRTGTDFLPVDAVARAVTAYVAEANADGDSPVGASSDLTDDLTVETTCRSHPHIALGGTFGYGDGIDRTAHASARAALGG